MRDRRQELVDAIFLTYGCMPTNWNSRLPDIEAALSKLPPLSNGRLMPLSTYFLSVVSKTNIASMVFVNPIISEENIKKFIDRYPEMEEAAKVEGTVDVKNFCSEVDAFGSVSDAITAPHLEISPLYRYIAAIQQSCSILIDDSLFESAKRHLRRNPYRFFAYGDESIEYMPLTWEEI